MFKVKKLKFKEHVYLDNLNLNFIGNKEIHNGPYSTLIIGPNGTGKSHILSALIHVFNILIASQNSNKLVKNFDFDFELIYLYEKDEFQVNFAKRKFSILINNQKAFLEDLNLPSKVIATAINHNDRFPFLKKWNRGYNDRYNYNGIKTTTNAIYIANHIKKIIDDLSEAARRSSKLENLNLLFEKLNISSTVRIVYTAGERFTLNQKETGYFKRITNDELSFVEYYKNLIDKNTKSKTGLRTIGKYLKYFNNENPSIGKVLEFIKKHSKVFDLKSKLQLTFVSEVDFSDKKSIINFVQEAETIQILRDLDLLKVQRVDLLKKGQFSMEYASSGEYHLLSSFLGMVATIEDNALLLIDEPEISLHPNWQMQYMEVLNKVFENYVGCHFIIATHSHFLVSDLIANKSAILSLKYDHNLKEIKAKLKNDDTYSWSAEQVLLEIFEVPTTRNYYVSELVGEILEKLADPSYPNDLIKEKIKYLKDLNLENLKANDPLKEIVDSLIAKL